MGRRQEPLTVNGYRPWDSPYGIGDIEKEYTRPYLLSPQGRLVKQENARRMTKIRVERRKQAKLLDVQT